MKLIRAFLSATLVVVPGIAGADDPPAASSDDASAAAAITISPVVPKDIPGGAPNASLATAATFAWQEFIALNWPAKAGQRDVPDTTQNFGAGTGPLVWHTYRAKIEIFPGTNSASSPPAGYSAGPPTYGYNTPPSYVYNAGVGTNGVVPACSGQTPPPQPAWINLDEVTQIGLDSMYAGINPAAAQPKNAAPQLIRFMAKANSVEYTYVAANKYWYEVANAPRRTARQNFIKAVNTGTFPPASPYINFPAGTIETKAAFRPLTAAEQSSQRFYSTTVRYYETASGGGPCYREAVWGLVALHIIQKTPTAPAFVFATFEQADNLLTVVNGKPVAVEDVNGKVINPSGTATSPALTYKDDPNNPQVSVVAGQPYCNTKNNPHLFYNNTAGQTGVPTGGSICVNQRDRAIPPPIVTANQQAHAAIATYSQSKGIKNSPWQYYKLVNVQAYPFSVTQIVNNPSDPHNAATFYLANSVVETNYTLQNFNGRVASNGAPTNYTSSGTLYQQNAYVLNANGSLKASYDMGGCMGCHSVAQSTLGADFSFILGNQPARAPETAANAQQVQVSQTRFKAVFDPDAGVSADDAGKPDAKSDDAADPAKPSTTR